MTNEIMLYKLILPSLHGEKCFVYCLLYKSGVIVSTYFSSLCRHCDDEESRVGQPGHRGIRVFLRVIFPRDTRRVHCGSLGKDFVKKAS